MRQILAFSLIGLLFTPLASAAQETESQDAEQSAQSDTVAAAAISISDLANRTGEVAQRLRAAIDLAAPDPDVTEIGNQWPEFSAVQSALRTETDEGLASGVSDGQLQEILRRWEVQHQQLESWEIILGNRIDALNGELSVIREARESWTLTRSSAVQDNLPASLVAQVDSVLAAVELVTSSLRSRLDHVLEIEGNVTFENIEVVSSQERLGKFQSAVLADRLSRLDKPLWRLFDDDSTEQRRVGKARLVEAAEISARYLSEFPGFVAVHIGLLLFLIIAFRLLGRQIARLADDDLSLTAPAQILSVPWLPAALVSLIATDVIYPLSPDGLIAFATIVSIPITIVLIRRQLPNTLHHMLFGLGALVLFFAIIRSTAPPGSLFDRLGMFAVALVSVLSATWFLRPGGSTDVLELSRLGRLVISASRTGLFILAVSIIADTLGYVELAHHGTKASMIAIYFGLYFYVGALIVGGAATSFLRTGFPQRSRTIAKHTTVIQKRITSLIFLGGGVYWLYVVFETLGLSDPLFQALTDLVGRQFGLGDIEISLLDILAFVITLWISLKGAQIFRAILDEDVLGRMELPRGLPIAVSGLTFYFLVALGFAFALSAAGVPLDRLALLTGALGIGIGFGLQDMVRNFISGLILMIERPVKVGDTIEFGQQAGVIVKIGIRSSVVRVWEGADVIVPNSHLVTNEVKNWTMNDSSRRIDVNLTVAYDSDPEKVTEILLAVAKNYEGIAADPPPAVVFAGFGDRGMEFSLRTWVHDPDGWLGKRTELSVEVQKRLTDAGIEFPVALVPGPE
jgi:potassium efflux system protein